MDYLSSTSPRHILGGSPCAVSGIPTNPYNNDASAIDTLNQMRLMAVQSSADPLLRSHVQSILKANQNSPMDLVRAIYWWVKGRILFIEDESIAIDQLGMNQDSLMTATGSIDLLISPSAIIRMPRAVGDCDDFSMLLAAMLIAAGFKVWFVAVAVDPKEPSRLSHVYVQTTVNGGILPLDASHGAYPGWESSDAYRRMEWGIN